MKNQCAIGLTGEIEASVLNPDGSVAYTLPKVRNLWTNRGLDALARLVIPDAFTVCVKGLGQVATKETVTTGNTYTLASSTLTRAAGTRDFTSNDVGKLVRTVETTPRECLISSFTDATHVDVTGVGSNGLPAGYSTKNVLLYSVQLTALTQEAHLTTSSETLTKSSASPNIEASGSVFTSDHVGMCIFVRNEDDGTTYRFKILTVSDGENIVVDSDLGEFTDASFGIYVSQGDLDHTPLSRTSQTSLVSGENSTVDTKVSGNLTGERVLKRTFVFDPEPQVLDYVPGGGLSLTWVSTGVTRVAGTRDFTSADVGKYLKFADGKYCKITARTSATVVVVDRAPSASTTSDVTIYGYASYDGVAFSDSDDPDSNANIIVRLENGSGVDTPVLLLGAGPELPGQQLKIAYTCKVSVFPAVETGRTLAPITDPLNLMSSNKFGTAAIEGLALATIDGSGNTQTDFAILEPFIPGSAALSPINTALAPFKVPDRSAGAAYVDLVPTGYIAGTFTQVYEGKFLINDAIATNWKCLGIYDTGSSAFGYVFHFEQSQNKTGDVILVARFSKTWNRDLS